MLRSIFSGALICILIEYVSATPCIPRHYGYDSFVCVCNSSYCDFAPPPLPLSANQYVLYTSSMGGLRLEKTSGTLLGAELTNNTKGYKISITRDYLTTQDILGFGGAFTDAAGININSLSQETQNKLMKSYFAPEGIAYSFGRIPMGGCDFSTRGYTYADTPSDAGLSRFNLTEEDYTYKIPLIQQAYALHSTPLRLIGSAWSAPAWMKTNNALTGQGELKTEYYQTWADYYIRFLDAYEKAGISFWALTTGNEPINGELPSFLPFVPKFNSMGWRPSTVAGWIANHLGPTIKASPYNGTKILAVDDQRFVLPWWLDEMIASEKKCESHIDGIGIHWYWDQLISVSRVDVVHQRYPQLLLINTEASVGDKPWDFVKVQLGSWTRAEYYISDIIENLNHGLVAWLEWNLALNRQGGPNWKQNYVDSPIIVNSATDEFYKQPMFYGIGHFSKFIRRGARVLKVNSKQKTISVLATIDKDSHVVIVMFNPLNRNVPVTVIDQSNKSIPLTLLKRSVVTLIYQA